MINARMASRLRQRGLVPFLDDAEYSSQELKILCEQVKAILDELNEVDSRIEALALKEEQDERRENHPPPEVQPPHGIRPSVEQDPSVSGETGGQDH